MRILTFKNWKILSPAFFLMVSTFLFLQCGSVPATYYYQIDYGNSPSLSSETIPLSLAIGKFDTDIIYEGDRIVYRNSPYEVQYYHYRRWIAPPHKLVENAVLEKCQSSGLFQRVTPLGNDMYPEYILSGRIKAFEEWDEGESWFGNVKIYFELEKVDSGEIIWQKEFSEKKQASAKEPLAVVKAISASVNVIIESALTELGQRNW